MRSAFFSLVFAAGFGTFLFAEAFDLEVYASKFDSIPIGVVDFTSKNKNILKKDLPGDVIAADLDFCGRFIVVKKPSFDSTVFADSGIGIYIDGEYEVSNRKIVIECFLRDAANRELIIGKKYKGELKFCRSMAHRYSNEIVEMLFGDRGIFESRFLFVRMEGKKKNIAIMDFDGFNRSNLTNNDYINIFPAFGDKSTVIWTSFRNGTPDLFRGSIYSGASKLFVSSKGVETSADVSPIDGTVAYASSRKGNLDIYTCRPDGSATRRLTMHYGVDTSPSWSPNGYQIAFTSDRSGNPQIYVMDADGANQRRISFNSKYADSPAWSPKGDRVAYMSMAENGRFTIWMTAPDGSDPVQIASLNGNNEYPTWSPDGSLLAFVNSYGGRGDLYVIKPNGSRVRRITSTGDVKMPDWSGF
ncbi:MAG: PD40 domain-containing protein [Chitinispirillaceae bacterium]|nr:PD40 domain-containing protein [Chitinispirillaceae bacterium]